MTYVYDHDSRLTQITAPSPDGSAPQPVTGFAYEYRGRRTSVTDANTFVPAVKRISEFSPRGCLHLQTCLAQS